MAKRSGRYYYKNEKQTMRDLGFKPTAASGSGWLEKEDGQSDAAIAQLKSTDNKAISVTLSDIKKLEHNAAVSHKRPVFVIQFLQNHELYVLLKPDDELLEYIHSDLQYDPVDLDDHDIDRYDIKETDSTAEDQRDPGMINNFCNISRKEFYEEGGATNVDEIKNSFKVRRSFSKEKPERQLEPELPI